MYIELNKTGKIFGKEVKCVLSNERGCRKCVFENECNPRMKNRPQCMAHERPDRESVCYIAV